MKISGWLWTDGHIVGNLSDWSMTYGWLGDLYETREDAIEAGLIIYGSDDFNLAHIVDGVVVWWGWMTEAHPLDDAADFAAEHGFLVALGDAS